MLLGLLSDTHGEAGRTARAVALLRRHRVDMILHCGDLGSESVLTELAAAGVPVHAVLGNVDLHNDELQRFPETTGVRVHGRFADLELGRHRIAIVHGDDERLFREALQSLRFDYMFTGHTHQTRDERVGRTRVINPGAVYRASPPTVAVLDTDNDSLTILRLPPGNG